MKITEWLAIYAALLSTIVFLWNVVRSKPKIKVRIIFGFDEKKGGGVYICTQNKSAHTVHLSSVSILYPYKTPVIKDKLSHLWEYKRLPKKIGWVHASLSYYDISHGCPVSLNARDAHEIFIPERALDEILRKASSRQIMANAQDKLWNNAYSNVFEYPLTEPKASSQGA